MRGFDAKFIDELKNKNDIADVVGKYVPLERKGGNFWGRCPFHHEKTASFCVNPQGQFYYCFGCHKSGDVISFIREIESLDFADAVKLLAERAKMPLPDVRYDDEQVREQKKRKERLLSLLRDTALFYAHNLRTPAATKHVDYIYKRKITNETVMRFGLGASLDFKGLPSYLRTKGYTDEEMVASGAVGEKNGRYFDWLGGRLIIPVIDQFGNVVAFDGRRIDDGKEQKYINTRETAVFSKGKTLFNINNLKKVKNEKGLTDVIIVEGHLDVVTVSQAGFPNVVASMGTSLTKDQARMLKRYTDKAYISYDGDFAGQKATVRGLEILRDEGLEVKIVSLPDGKDPDDVIKTEGAEAYRKYVADAMPLIDFKLQVIKRAFDLNTVDGKRKYASNAIRVIRESPSAAEQEDLLKAVREATGFTFEALKRELYSEVLPEEVKTVPVPDIVKETGDKTTMAASFVLYAFLFGKSYAQDTDINEIEFTLPAHIAIKSYIQEKTEAGERPRFTDLYEILPEEYGEERDRIARMETDGRRVGAKKFDEATYFDDCVRTLKIYELERKAEMLTSRFKAETDEDVRRSVAEELNSVMKRKSLITGRRE